MSQEKSKAVIVKTQSLFPVRGGNQVQDVSRSLMQSLRKISLQGLPVSDENEITTRQFILTSTYDLLLLRILLLILQNSRESFVANFYLELVNAKITYALIRHSRFWHSAETLLLLWKGTEHSTPKRIHSKIKEATLNAPF